MAQQSAAQAAPRGGELTIYGEKHPAFAYCFQADVLPMLEENLRGNKDGLTVRRLALDLASLLIANPDLATVAADKPKAGQSRVSKECVFGLILEATRYGTTFGDGGLWVIPDDKDVPTLRAQQSKKFIVQRAQDDAECKILPPVFVHKPDHPVLIERDPASGDIVKFTLNKDADITAERNVANLLGAFGRVETADGKLRIRWFSKGDLDRYRDHSTAYKAGKSPAWATDAMEMYAGSVRAAMGREFAPIRTRVPGMVGTSFLPAIEMQQAEDGEYAAPTAASAAADLAKMAELPVPFSDAPPAAPPASDDPVERIRAMVHGCATLDGINDLWKAKEFLAEMAKCDSGQRKHVGNIREQREKEIREAVVAAARAEQASAAPPQEAGGKTALERFSEKIAQCKTTKELHEFWNSTKELPALAEEMERTPGDWGKAKAIYTARKEELTKAEAKK